MKKLRYLLPAFLLIGICLNLAAQDVEVFPQLGHSDHLYTVAFTSDGWKIEE